MSQAFLRKSALLLRFSSFYIFSPSRDGEPLSRRKAQLWSCLSPGCLAASLAAVLLTGCGGGGTTVSNPPPPSPQTTTVLLTLTSTANGRLPEFAAGIESVVLTSSAGTPVVLYSNANISGAIEYMDLNGISELLLPISAPEGTYTASTVELTYCNFTALGVDSQGALAQSSYSTGSAFSGQFCGAGSAGTGSAIVKLPSPITIAGSLSVLSLNLQVPQSYTLDTTTTPATFMITPVFTLTEIAKPNNAAEEQRTEFAMRGVTVQSSVNGNMTILYGGEYNSNAYPIFTVETNSSTVGLNNIQFSVPGGYAIVNLDAIIQPDGSLLATRIDLPSMDNTDGLIASPGPNAEEFSLLGFCGLFGGCLLSQQNGTNPSLNIEYDGNTTFGISPQLGNLASLPFVPTFNSATIFPGQRVSGYASPFSPPQDEQPFEDVTLRTQTVNGTVADISVQGGFGVYTVELPAYDVIPALQGLKSLTTHLTAPNIITVYADANVEMLNSAPIAVGGIFRFRGLLFNDGGNLRMDCSRVNDGVAE